MPNNLNLTVFEAINDSLKEIFVTATSQPIFDALARLRAERPDAIKHWNLRDVVTIRSIEFHLNEDEARAFIAEYVKTKALPGWRYLTEKVLKPAK